LTRTLSVRRDGGDGKAEAGVKFSNFLFPESRDPERDGAVIDETLREARLADELGVDVIWLAEHHFDGVCAYVDPISFAAALATATRRAKIGFAVVQTSLHHPVRLAEQLSLIDHLSQGRLIVGLGRGTAYNIYDYQGYGLDHEEAQARFEEAESIILKAWTGDRVEHHGKFWNLQMPLLRPRPFTRPHPLLIRGASGEHSMVELARAGRPFLMNVQTNEVTKHRMDLYRKTMRESGHDEEAVQRNVEQCWIWRNVVVAETDAEAKRIGHPAFAAMQEHRAAMRNRIYAEQGVRIREDNKDAPATRTDPTHALICGSPETVAAAFAEIDKIGVGGVIMQFRLGPMAHEAARNSLELFMRRVAPAFRGRET
jgi:alkanesulfonate monooxygenase SsuD/methylene tetrahydromethanopterin reductase-like flavin-dependent oxidoreductase (luciferase family)